MNFKDAIIHTVKQNGDTKYRRKEAFTLVDTQYLVQAIKDNGLKREYIAKRLGCTRQHFSNKLRKGDFKLSEANILCDIFGFTAKERDRVFFAKDVTNNGDGTT